MDETRERHAEGEASGSHLQATAGPKTCEISAEWLSSWCVGKKAVVAVRRLARLEKEHSQLEDEEREASQTGPKS